MKTNKFLQFLLKIKSQELTSLKFFITEITKNLHPKDNFLAT